MLYYCRSKNRFHYPSLMKISAQPQAGKFWTATLTGPMVHTPFAWCARGRLNRCHIAATLMTMGGRRIRLSVFPKMCIFPSILPCASVSCHSKLIFPCLVWHWTLCPREQHIHTHQPVHTLQSHAPRWQSPRSARSTSRL